MIITFLRDRRGNFAMMTALVMAPIMGVLALAVDYTQISRQRQMTLNALDAAGIATARRIAEGATDEEAKVYAEDFFRANLRAVKPENAVLHVLLPNDNAGGGTLKLTADLKYAPIFFPVFQSLRGEKPDGPQNIDFQAQSEIRLKNTLEVALVLDNSGSMDFVGIGSTEKRLTILKKAAKELVKTIAAEGAQMKQISKPVQFGVVPFAGAVNVGPQNATASWMDTDGRSPVHHENFDWSSMGATDPNKRVEESGGVYYKRGSGWGPEENAKATRFSLFDALRRKDCTQRDWYGNCKSWSYTKMPGWAGCVEMRPYPYNLNDEAPNSARPETYFVPMFAPDETDWTNPAKQPANNNWWTDISSSSNSAARQAFMPKYFAASETAATDADKGPNAGCTTKAITPLTDVGVAAGLSKINTAIDAMVANGSTNVTEGIAWGWRVVSGSAPFTEGRGDKEKGNDKVVIVLTDGANTYYTPDSVIAQIYSGTNYRYGGNDLAGSRSIYSNYGYARNRAGDSRIFEGTGGISKNDFSNDNYSSAMTQHMVAACENAKAGRIIMMTVALDLKSNNAAESKQIEALKACASESRTRKGPDGKPVKLFWNATGGDLDDAFKAIGDELSNLRIVG
ncbi:pilus assembly protein [Nitratireductor sp. ZSWI3]|uniref:pilus assembly protein n=1 Tax=Nitratireductor sp. ZSWI3 TaxID=2966359 RepID=UPI00215024DF|nr:pilus assembly protein [Nitratireductor sp. ZSWI3]MCR4269290.1 pilus assembly protein TadG-related protein [Nitratireductor sp. ZSWI3]